MDKITISENISIKEAIIKYRDWLLGGWNLKWEVTRDPGTLKIILIRW